VLDGDHGIAGLDQAVQLHDQLFDVRGVQAGGGLIGTEAIKFKAAAFYPIQLARRLRPVLVNLHHTLSRLRRAAGSCPGYGVHFHSRANQRPKMG